ncbi:MAG: BhlA/UviB family holin-like peptide [Eubacteriales bacterium]|nr:BhlA/UviB family holin-like peptide [Eubacteriales bacterium]
MEMTAIADFAVRYGIFAALFVALFVWTMKENKSRETAMRITLDKVNDKILNTVCLTERGVNEIDEKVEKVEVKIDVLDNKVDGLIHKVDGLDKKIKG